jgi:hypothetical protein
MKAARRQTTPSLPAGPTITRSVPVAWADRIGMRHRPIRAASIVPGNRTVLSAAKINIGVARFSAALHAQTSPRNRRTVLRRARCQNGETRDVLLSVAKPAEIQAGLEETCSRCRAKSRRIPRGCVASLSCAVSLPGVFRQSAATTKGACEPVRSLPPPCPGGEIPGREAIRNRDASVPQSTFDGFTR